MITILNNAQLTEIDNYVSRYAKEHLNWYCSPRSSFTAQVEEHTKVCDVVLIASDSKHKDKQVSRIRSLARNQYPKTVFTLTPRNCGDKYKEGLRYILDNDCQKIFVYTDTIYNFTEGESNTIQYCFGEIFRELVYQVKPRYAFFAWKDLYAKGGWGDLVDTYVTLKAAQDKKNKFIASERAWYEWNIVDLKRGIVIEKGK